jgi:hypothetical protein
LLRIGRSRNEIKKQIMTDYSVARAFATRMDTAELVGDRSEWDRKVRADIAIELEKQFPGPAFNIVRLQRMLAIKGYHEVAARMRREVGDHTGVDAVRACAVAMRGYILDRPGMASATWLTPTAKDAAWSAAAESAAFYLRKAFCECGLQGEAVTHAMRLLRSLVRGYVVHEMANAFVKPIDCQRSFDLGVSVFINGLPVLRGANTCPFQMSA